MFSKIISNKAHACANVLKGDMNMSNNKACRYLNRDTDHPSFIFSMSQNENPYLNYIGVCTASGDFTQSIQCTKLTKENISNNCMIESKYSKCSKYIQKTYGSNFGFCEVFVG
jgi:hypothetical protein